MHEEQPIPCLSNEVAKKIFQRAWKDSSVIFTKHARERMKERNIDNNDLILLARSGTVLLPPEPDIKTGEWKYIIEMTRPIIKAVFTVQPANKIRLLTVENE